MRADTGGGDSWSANTNFEQFTHADLLKMMAGANPAAVSKVGTTLAEASTHMQSLADDLATHINGLVWDGDAGDAFKTWARQVVSATDTLAIFTSNTAVGINMASETLSSTQVPPIPEADQATVNAYKRQFDARTFVGPDGEAKVAKPLLSTNPTLSGSNASSAITHLVTQETAYQAQTRLDAAHQEAIGQMEKLGGAYVGAQSTLTVSTVPTFPPTPAALMPPQGSGKSDYSGNVGGVNTGTSSSGVTGGVATTVSGTKSTRKSTSGSTSEEDPGTSTFEPVTSPGAGSTTETGGGSTGSSGSTTLQGVTDPNAPSGSGGNNNTGGGGTPGGSGGTTGPTSPTGGNGVVIAPPPGGGVTSTGPGPGSTTTTGPGGSNSTGIGGGNNRTGGATGEPEPGIHGGMPTPVGGRTTSRAGSGVIGAEGDGAGVSASALGRGRIGGAAAGVEGAGGGAASVAESAGSSTARSGLGSAAAGEGAAAAAGEGHSGGMMPMGGGGMGGAAGGKGRRRQRAAYLTEDEETWTQDVQANPTVIQ